MSDISYRHKRAFLSGLIDRAAILQSKLEVAAVDKAVALKERRMGLTEDYVQGLIIGGLGGSLIGALSGGLMWGLK